ncbi:MAG: GDSL-like Lipase/Acylhydrolase family [Actinomycetota bacterium]|jgi:lysophospholipase L1-like esterase|nr:GDSL-like Lipase/Acylhydrolase family [Actinomycetota bacterium]
MLTGRTTKSRVARAVVLFAACLALPAWSCSTTQSIVGDGRPTLQFVGDSITFQSTDDINAHYGTAHDVGIWAIVGATTLEAAAEVAVEAKAGPDIEVINLGTNDAHTETATELAGTLSRLKAMRSEFRASTCVVWVTINENNPTWGPENARTINALLRTFAHVADWAAANVPADFPRADTPHPNETGRQHLLAIEDRAIAGCTG